MKALTRMILAAAICASGCGYRASWRASTNSDAQTYTSTTPHGCDMASVYPITSFSQFSCRGLEYDGNGIELFFWGGAPRIELFTPTFTIGPYTSSLTLTTFSRPKGKTPGTFAFTWMSIGGNGVEHSGEVMGTWEDNVVCGGRGCLWHRPLIKSSSITIF